MIEHFLTVGSRNMPLFCAERNERDLVIFQSRFINDDVLYPSLTVDRHTNCPYPLIHTHFRRSPKIRREY